MSVFVMVDYQAAYFTCDHLGGKPEHRSACRNAVTIPLDPGSPATIPPGWRRAGRAHLCPDHVDSASVYSLTWATISPPQPPTGS